MRLNLNEAVTPSTNEDFEKLLEEYLAKKEIYDKQGAELDNMKSKIRTFLEDREDLTYVCDIAKAQIQVRKSVQLNEEGLIIRLEEMGVEDPIKTKRYIDTTVLEDAMHRGEVQGTDVAPYMSEKTSYAVVVRRIKK